MSAADTPNAKVWFITGTSTGFGRHLVLLALARGDRVIATARALHKLDFPPSDRLRVLHLDLDSPRDVITAQVHAGLAIWGRIDVLVNNAGYAAQTLFEEGGSEECRKQFQTNVFGLIDVTTAALPSMRERRSGTIVMIGSRSSWKGEVPTTSFYAASKAAVNTFSETLAVEVAQFGIRVLIVEPGMFRTEGIFAQPFNTRNAIPDYDAYRREVMALWDTDRLTGDPVKGAQVIVDVVRGEGKAAGRPWPLYLVIGPGAEETVIDKCRKVVEVIDAWKDVTENLVL